MQVKDPTYTTDKQFITLKFNKNVVTIYFIFYYQAKLSWKL